MGSVPQLWRDPSTSDRDRKRMACLILEDVTLKRDQSTVAVQVRFKGGATRILNVPVPLRTIEQRKTKPEIVAEIDRQLDHCSASDFNKKGWKSLTNQPFSASMVQPFITSHHLIDRKERLRAQGFISAREVTLIIGIQPLMAERWRQLGLLTILPPKLFMTE